MRYLELLVTDVPDDAAPITRTEWIHRDHIETVEPYTTTAHGQLLLWLQITLTSGAARYLPLRPVHPDEVDAAARAGVRDLLESGGQPIRAGT